MQGPQGAQGPQGPAGPNVVLVNQSGNTVGPVLNWRETTNEVNGATWTTPIVHIVVPGTSTAVEVTTDGVAFGDGLILFDEAGCLGHAFALPHDGYAGAVLPRGAYMVQPFPPLIQAAIAVQESGKVALYAASPGGTLDERLVLSKLQNGACSDFGFTVAIEGTTVYLAHSDLHGLFPPPCTLQMR